MDGNDIAILGSTIALGVIAFANDIGDKFPSFRFLKLILVKLLVVAIASCIIYNCNSNKEQINEQKGNAEKATHVQELKTMDSIFREEKRNADSVHEVRIRTMLDSSYIKSMKSSNEALAKYNLIYVDSLRKVEGRINTKSIMAQIAIAPVENNQPSIYVYNDVFDYLRVKFLSSGNTSYNIKWSMCILKLLKNGGFDILQSYIGNDQRELLVPGSIRTNGIPLIPTITQYDEDLCVVLRCTFSRDEDGKFPGQLDHVALFNFKQNKYALRGVTIDRQRLLNTLLADKKL